MSKGFKHLFPNDKIRSERTEKKKKHRVPCTKMFFLSCKYNDILCRTCTTPKAEPRWAKYRGLEKMSRSDFMHWGAASSEFHRLWEVYVEADYLTELAPSCDRIDSDFGYVLDNVQCVTVKQNKINGWMERRRKKRAKQNLR